MTGVAASAPLVAAGLGVPLDGVALPLGTLRVSVRLVAGAERPAWAVPTLVRGLEGLDLAALGVEVHAPPTAGLGEGVARTAALVRAINVARTSCGVAPIDDATAIDLVRQSARREVGHPLTATAHAAWLGRAQCACGQEPYAAVSLSVSPGMRAAVVQPAVAPDPDAVRTILTAQITQQKSLELGARAATAVAALVAGDAGALAGALLDRGMLRPFERFVPGIYPVHAAAHSVGAALFVCGRGPAVCVIAPTAAAIEAATAAIQDTWRAHAVASEVLDEWTT